MALSKKHYEQFAQLFRNQIERINADTIYPFPQQQTNDAATASAQKFAVDHLQNMAASMAAHFALDNPRFDRARFLRACGFEG